MYFTLAYILRLLNHLILDLGLVLLRSEVGGQRSGETEVQKLRGDRGLGGILS